MMMMRVHTYVTTGIAPVAIEITFFYECKFEVIARINRFICLAYHICMGELCIYTCMN